MICALTLAYAWGQDTVFVEPVDGPQITFSDPSKDLGTITQGEIVEHSFVFSNTGNQPLVISDVLVTCGCTVPEWPREPVAPVKETRFWCGSIQLENMDCKTR